jgi:hypothetical protein
MDTSTRAARIAVAHRLTEALRRAPGDTRPDADTGGPIGNCGRGEDEECGMRNPEECSVHCSPADSDPALLGLSGTLASRKQQLRLARRRGLRL